MKSERQLLIEAIGRERQESFYNFWCSRYTEEHGFAVYNNAESKAGPDIIIMWNNIPYMVIEITNYAESSYMQWNRLYRYINNLNQYPQAYKLLVVSYPENFRYTFPRQPNRASIDTVIRYTEELVNSKGINLMYMGRQDKPLEGWVDES